MYLNHWTQGENIGGKIQPADDSDIYLNIVSMTNVSREFKTVVSIGHPTQIPKNHILKCSFYRLNTSGGGERGGTKILQSDM